MRSRTPRSDRFWKPPTDFDRPPLRESITDLLAGIPETEWDTPMDALIGDTPRESATHISESGCPICRFNLQNLRKEQP